MILSVRVTRSDYSCRFLRSPFMCSWDFTSESLRFVCVLPFCRYYGGCNTFISELPPSFARFRACHVLPAHSVGLILPLHAVTVYVFLGLYLRVASVDVRMSLPYTTAAVTLSYRFPPIFFCGIYLHRTSPDRRSLYCTFAPPSAAISFRDNVPYAFAESRFLKKGYKNRVAANFSAIC